MTKQEEIQTLKDTARALGRDSYIGPWLDSVLPFIEQDIAADFPPSPTWGELRDAEGRAQVQQAMAAKERDELSAAKLELERKQERHARTVAAFNAHVEKSIDTIRDLGFFNRGNA